MMSLTFTHQWEADVNAHLKRTTHHCPRGKMAAAMCVGISSVQEMVTYAKAIQTDSIDEEPTINQSLLLECVSSESAVAD